jgi:hypothetical protein
MTATCQWLLGWQPQRPSQRTVSSQTARNEACETLPPNCDMVRRGDSCTAQSFLQSHHLGLSIRTLPCSYRLRARLFVTGNTVEVQIMKSLQGIVIAVVLATPLASFAQQSNAPVSRSEVRAELVQLERAGYNPAKRDNSTYPADIQAAEARVAARNSATGGVGGVTSGAAQSGQRTSAATSSSPLFRHH